MPTLEEQISAAEANLAQAKARLEQAKLDPRSTMEYLTSLNNSVTESKKTLNLLLSQRSPSGATAAGGVTVVTLSPESIHALATAIAIAIEERRTVPITDIHTPSEPEVEEGQETDLSVIGSRVQVVRGLHIRKDASRYLGLLKRHITKLYPNFKVRLINLYGSEVSINEEVLGSSVTKLTFHYTAGEVKKVYMTLLLSESMEAFLTFCNSATFSPYSDNEYTNEKTPDPDNRVRKCCQLNSDNKWEV